MRKCLNLDDYQISTTQLQTREFAERRGVLSSQLKDILISHWQRVVEAVKMWAAEIVSDLHEYYRRNFCLEKYFASLQI